MNDEWEQTISFFERLKNRTKWVDHKKNEKVERPHLLSEMIEKLIMHLIENKTEKWSLSWIEQILYTHQLFHVFWYGNCSPKKSYICWTFKIKQIFSFFKFLLPQRSTIFFEIDIYFFLLTLGFVRPNRYFLFKNGLKVILIFS